MNWKRRNTRKKPQPSNLAVPHVATTITWHFMLRVSISFSCCFNHSPTAFERHLELTSHPNARRQYSCRTVLNSSVVFDGNPEYFQLSEKAPDGSTVQYPVHLRRGKAGDGSILLAEVHWADLARIGHGTDELLYELFRLIYGIRHIVIHAATQSGNIALALNLLFRVVFFFRSPKQC